MTMVAAPASRETRLGGDTEVATLALLALTVVTALGMARLFSTGAFVPAVLAAAVGAHATAWAARQLRLPAVAAVVVPAVATALIGVWFVIPGSTVAGIPWLGSWHAATTALATARDDFAHAVAPVVPAPGYVLAAVVGVGLVAVFADWAAFRLGSAYEAVIPALGLFLFVAILGDARWRWASVGAELAAALAFLAVHGARSRAASTPWFATRTPAAARPLLQGAAALIAAAVVVAVVVGPRLPGAHAAGLVNWRNRDSTGSGKRTTVSPLVDIRGRLVEQSYAEAFSVRTTERAYWRLTALDLFDGVIWSSNDNYRKAGSKLPSTGAQPPALAVGQSFSIRNLSSIWLPAAFRPTQLSDVGGVSFNSDSASLITQQATSDGLTYRVVSEKPSLTAADLAKSPRLDPKALAHYLALPPVSPRVADLARRIVATAATPYAQARALQDHLRANYRYDLDVQQGHDERALERFLFVTRAGYCEQFAAAYAVMARVVGLPSRVAVGFTPGEQAADGTYHVLGLHAHAWPEVYLDGFGWVAFEPTPGRGAPGAQDYTGVPESQASAARPETATTAVPSTTIAVAQLPTTTSTATSAPPRPPSLARARHRRLGPLFWAILAVVLAAAAWGLGVPALRRSRRARRRAAARTPAERVLVAWTEADEALALADARRRASETLREHADRVRPTVPDGARQPLAGLARDAAEASYAPDVRPELVRTAIAAAAEVEAAVNAASARSRRLRRDLSPRG